MEADAIPKIFRPFSNVLQHQINDITTSGSEQPHNIGCSIVPQMRDSPTSFYQMVADGRLDYPQLFTRGFSPESDELLNYLHLAPEIQ